MAGAELGFGFSYRLYGPYSEQLSIAISDADALGLIEAEDRTAEWGGRYSVFRIKNRVPEEARRITAPLRTLASTAAKADSIVLELAVTAAFLARSGSKDPW